MSKLSGFLVLIAVFLVALSGTAKAQNLTFTPAVVNVSIPGPGAVPGASVTVGATNGATVTSLFVSTINTN